MKYIVEVKYTNPAHEHVSLRRRVESVNRIVEARSEAEAINRVANQQRALGFMIKEAKIKEAIDPKRFMRPVENQLPAGLDKPKKKPEEAKKEPVKEEAIDEARPMSDPVFRSVATKALTKDMDPNFGYAANKLPAHIKAAQAKSDVLSKVVKRPQAGTLAAVHKSMEREMMKKEEVEYIEEKLTASDPASKWIHDFVHSDNPKFAGKSKKERINMALGAKYAADRAVKEEVEDIDEANKMSRVEWRMGTENEVDKNNKRIYDRLAKENPEKAAAFHDNLMKLKGKDNAKKAVDPGATKVVNKEVETEAKPEQQADIKLSMPGKIPSKYLRNKHVKIHPEMALTPDKMKRM